MEADMKSQRIPQGGKLLKWGFGYIDFNLMVDYVGV